MHSLKILDQEFESLKKIIYTHSGINLKPTKKTLLISRLRARLIELNIVTFTDYINYIHAHQRTELQYLINAVSTNETYFMRHNAHFDYLKKSAFPDFMKYFPSQKCRIWSAASSTGEEAYSLAITCSEYKKLHPNFSFEITASDINTDIINTARNALFSQHSLKRLSDRQLKIYFKAEGSHFRLYPEISNMVQFKQHNLLNPVTMGSFHIIFLRNVLIYFDSKSKQKVHDNITNSLTPNSHLFISLSESLYDINTSLKLISTGIFKKES